MLVPNPVYYSYISNETGHFKNSDGDHGEWNATLYVYYYPKENQLKKHVFKVNHLEVDKNITLSAYASEALYTKIEEKNLAFAAAGVRLGITYNLVNKSYEAVGRKYRFFEGAGMEVNGTTSIDEVSMELINSTNNFSILGSHVQQEINITNSTEYVEGEIFQSYCTRIPVFWD